MARSSLQIKAEIESRLGFIPPFFEPAFEMPIVFENIWQQTLLSYIDNPLPNLFKEKLAALLARYCTVPYCLLCHSSALMPLGMTASGVLEILEQPPLSFADLAEKTKCLDVGQVTTWPEEGSHLEDCILYCSVAIFLDEDTDDCRQRLRTLLPPELFENLILYISYNRTALAWAEAHPELKYAEDARVKNHYATLTKDEPKLIEFFANYQSRVQVQSERRSRWLTAENRNLISRERALRVAVEEEKNRAETEREKLEATVDASSIGMALLRSPDMILEKVNSKFRELLNAKDLGGKEWSDIESDLPGFPLIEVMRLVLTSGEALRVSEVPLKITNSAGVSETHYYDLTYDRIVIGGDEPYGVLLQATDATDRVLDQNRISATAADLESTMESMNDAFFSIDKNWKITHVNSRMTVITGISEADTIGKDVRDLFFSSPEFKQSQYWIKYHETMKDRVPTDFLDYYEPLDLWTEVKAFPKDDGGMAVFFTDVGEAKHAERALSTERRKLVTMISEAPLGFALVTGEGLRFEMVNSKWRELVGPRDYIGRNYDETYPELIDYGVSLILREVYETGQNFSASEMEVRIVNEEGKLETRFYDFTYIRMTDADERAYGVLATAANVTDRVIARRALAHAKAEAERANELKSAFLANMSHEIRTPLGAMIGFADLLRDPGVTPGEKANYVNIMLRNGDQLSTIINDILDLSKVEAGHINFEFADVDHRRVGSEVLSLMQVKAGEKDLALEYSSDPSTPVSIVSDPTRVRQILLNLVSNAIKFTQFGSVRIRTYGCTAASDKPALCFEVTDTGIGITAEQQERLFQTFSQADETTTRRFGGTGLGLALSRRLARELGGDITITKSGLGIGTTFLVKIADQPERRTTNEVLKSESHHQPEFKERALEGLSILVVDDAPDNQQLIWRYLTRQGAAVESAENGLIGYRTALAGNFDLVLMDIQMPVMDGYTATQKLRDAGYQKPIIALTAHAMSEIRKKALNVGYTDHLTKPIIPAALIATIAKYTRREGLN